jgi:predicted phosphoribosyltransferase
MATTTPRRFRDRTEAGRLLAEQLRQYAGRDDVVVLALPRGGMPVAFEVARALDAPLDVFLVRKLGVPGHEELALGAIATGGMRVLNKQLIESLGIPAEWIEGIDAKERRELERRERVYRADRPPPDLAGKTVILVDVPASSRRSRVSRATTTGSSGALCGRVTRSSVRPRTALTSSTASAARSPSG